MTRHIIGRDRELTIAREVLVKARKQHMPARIVILGDPGIGKTILLEGVASAADKDGWFVLELGCHEIQRNTPFIALNRLISAAIRRLGTDSDRYISGLEEGLAAFDASIAHLLGLPPRDSALRKDRYRETCLRFFEGIGIDHSILITCDDMQWIDPQSAEMFDILASSLGQSALAVVSTERPSADGNKPRLPGETLLRLFPLDFNSTKALIQVLLPDAEDAIVETVAHHTGGNPLQTSALCEDLRHDGMARADRNLQDLIRDRIAEMSADEREFLQLCALLGEPIEYRVLFRLYPDLTRFGELLGASVAPYLIAEGPALRFRHALVLDAVRHTISFELPLRRKIVTALQAIESPDLTDYARIVEQAEALGDRDLVFNTYLRTAESAFARKEWSAVVKACERALTVRDPDPAQLVQFYLQYAVSLRSLERGAEASDVTREALRKAEFISLQEGTGALVALLMSELWAMENVDDALLVCDQFLARAANAADRADVLAVALMISATSLDESLFLHYDRLFDEVKGAARDYAGAVRNAANAMIASVRGDYDSAKQAVRRAVAEADRRASRQTDDLPFTELCIDVRQFGCGVARERLPNLLRKTRFESTDLVYGSLLSTWMNIASGDWLAARITAENALSIEAPLGFRASLIGALVMMSVLSNDSAPLPNEAMEIAERLIREGYWESGLQLIPWLLLRERQPDLIEFLRYAIGLRHQPRVHIIGYTPAGVSLAARAFKDDPLLSHIFEADVLRDRSPWSRAHWELAQGIALQGQDAKKATDLLASASAAFTRLDAHFFAAYAAEQAGRGEPKQQELLRVLGVVIQDSRSPAARKQKAKQQRFGLTPREWQVAQLIVNGDTNRQIAEALYLSERTVEVHVSNILSKLEVGSRTQLTRWMYERRVLS
ncbi:MAG: helix-turn-helix transcriptional regulator [Vulcanimicrobiaceae bacterium]